MKALRRSGLLAIFVLLAVLLAACSGVANQGSTTTTTATNPPVTNKVVTPTPNGAIAVKGNMDMMQGIAITPNTGGNPTALINTGKATVNGIQVNVLLTNKGFALYTFRDDAPLTSTCTGDCAKDWPAVLAAQGMTMASSSMTLPKLLSVHQTANGAQVFYDSHALYTYAADTQAGQAMGHGQDMKWYLVDTMAGTMASPTAGTPTPNMMMQGITITPGVGGNMDAFIHVGKAAINGNQVNVLMTNKGFAVYYFRDDTAFKSTCTGDCAKDWPAILAPQGMMQVSTAVALPKQLSMHQTANGAQLFYDGHALYTYAADKQANLATGRGQDLKWYLVGFLL